jgi:hypothetical protein
MDGEHACVCALDVSSIRKTDGDAGDDAGGCRCELDEIASDFEKCPVTPESIIIGGEGVDVLELIIWLILFKLLACSACSTVPPVHC